MSTQPMGLLGRCPTCKGVVSAGTDDEKSRKWMEDDGLEIERDTQEVIRDKWITGPPCDCHLAELGKGER